MCVCVCVCVLSLVSHAHRGPRAEALHPALQTRIPIVKQLCRHLSSVRTLNPRWRRWAVCRDAAPALRPGAWAAQLRLPHESSAPPTPRWQEPYKAAPPQPVGESMNSTARAHTSPFLEQRIKLSFASEPNSVSIYRLEWHRAEEPLLGTNLGGSVMLVLLWGWLLHKKTWQS